MLRFEGEREMDKVNNLAYDYSSYDQEEVVTSRKIKHKVNPGKKKSNGGFKVIGVAITAMALFCSMIYGRVELSSLYAKQSELETQLLQLNNENVSLESELAQKTGLTKVEEYAEDKLGLKKLDKSQIEYVEVQGETVAEVVAPEETNVFVKIKRWFFNVLEYIGA